LPDKLILQAVSLTSPNSMHDL